MNLEDYLPFGLTPDVVIVLMAGMAAVFSVLAVWFTLLHKDPLAPRLKMMAERRAALKAGLAAPRRRVNPESRRSVGAMRRILDRLKISRPKRSRTTADKLVQAGFRGKDATVVFIFCKLALPILFGIAAVVVLYVLQLYELTPQVKLMMTIGSVVFGIFAPDLYIKNAIDKRKKELRKGLPDALDLLVICAEAGLGMDAAFTRVAREMSNASPEMADELALTAIELSFLPERRKALENLNMRTDMPQIRGVVNTLIQTERYGTPLANSLRVLANEFRSDRLMAAEEKAAKLPATLTVPMVLFILPALFVVLIGPAVLRTIDALRGVSF